MATQNAPAANKVRGSQPELAPDNAKASTAPADANPRYMQLISASKMPDGLTTADTAMDMGKEVEDTPFTTSPEG